MKEKKLLVKTKRMMLYPLSDPDIQKMIDDCSDPELAEAYEQMLSGCKSNQSQRQWYAPWVMETKDGTRIGDIGFKGPASDGSVEIGYGVNREYEGRGYATEAAEALVNWAFDNDGVLFVEAEAEENNAASLRVLEKIGFVKYGQGEEGPRFVKDKPSGAYTSLGISVGLCFGLAIGMFAFDNMATGMGIGMMLGVCIGASKDAQEKKKMAVAKKDKYGLEQ